LIGIDFSRRMGADSKFWKRKKSFWKTYVYIEERRKGLSEKGIFGVFTMTNLYTNLDTNFFVAKTLVVNNQFTIVTNVSPL